MKRIESEEMQNEATCAGEACAYVLGFYGPPTIRLSASHSLCEMAWKTYLCTLDHGKKKSAERERWRHIVTLYRREEAGSGWRCVYAGL